MYVFVGSTNPVKVNAVKLALAEKYPEVQVIGYEVESGVSAQPMTDEETRTGAENRARTALQKGLSELANQISHEDEVLGVGMEGGVFQNDQAEVWSTVWGVVSTRDGQEFAANGARIRVPDLIGQPILKGAEMGPIIQQLTGFQDVRQKQGMFGIVTNGFVERTEEYSNVVKVALGLWHGRNWAVGL